MNITVPTRASHDFMMTKIGWSSQHPFRLTASVYPIDNPAHPIILDIKREMLDFSQLFVTLVVYEKYPEPHLTHKDINVLRESIEAAEFQMGTHTC